MNRDSFFRCLFVVLLGVYVPFLAGVISYQVDHWQYIITTSAFYILIYALAWTACRMFNAHIQERYPITASPFLKMLLLCFSSSLVAATALSAATIIWLHLSNQIVTWSPIKLTALLTTLASVVFTLLFEVARLSTERLHDKRTVKKLDRKWHKAQMNALKYEMDPHFIFNSLNTLSHLIHTDSNKAHLFNQKLAQVYKYFLTTKDKNLIPVAKELAFIRDYVYLLNIRYSEKLSLEINIDDLDVEQTLIVPCALQIPIENAIKHNELTSQEPLTIKVSFDGETLQVSNALRPKPYMVESTAIGLSNLNNRYQLACQKHIDVLKTNQEFIVKLPLVA
jgi:two-component system, LytTR family, sensor kinase